MSRNPPAVCDRRCRATWRPSASSASRSSPPLVIKRAPPWEKTWALSRVPAHAGAAAGTVSPLAAVGPPPSRGHRALGNRRADRPGGNGHATVARRRPAKCSGPQRTHSPPGRRAAARRIGSRPTDPAISICAGHGVGLRRLEDGPRRASPRALGKQPPENAGGRSTGLRLALRLAALPCRAAYDSWTRRLGLFGLLFSRWEEAGDRQRRRDRAALGCGNGAGASDFPRPRRRSQCGQALTRRTVAGHRRGRSHRPAVERLAPGLAGHLPGAHRPRSCGRSFSRWKNARQRRGRPGGKALGRGHRAGAGPPRRAQRLHPRGGYFARWKPPGDGRERRRLSSLGPAQRPLTIPVDRPSGKHRQVRQLFARQPVPGDGRQRPENPHLGRRHGR